MKDPLLIDVPTEILSPRLSIRAPRAGDGAAVNEAVLESFPELHRWMPWARTRPTLAESEIFVRSGVSDFARRTVLPMLICDRHSQQLVGASGLHSIDWNVPKFEIGYWCRTPLAGRGYVREAAGAIARMAFERLDAARVEIRTDVRNERSWRVAERLGFTLEGTLRSDMRAPGGELRDTRVYALTALGDLRD